MVVVLELLTLAYNVDRFEGFDMDVAEELRARARIFLEEQDKVLDVQRKELGVTDDLAAVEGLSMTMIVQLGQNEVKTLDDLADLAGDELREFVGHNCIRDGVRDWLFLFRCAVATLYIEIKHF